MAEVVPVIGAVAAVIAAVLAGVSVWATGRREERRWARDALVDTFVAYLQSSFSNDARAALEERQSANPDQQVVAALRSSCNAAHDAQMQALTRLRLLGTPSAVAAAERLHTADHEVTRYAFETNRPNSDDRWRDLRAQQRQSREAVIEAARAALGLGDTAPIEHEPGRSVGELSS
jgi:hypothetical protein